jgi:predicted transcriptional regulator
MNRVTAISTKQRVLDVLKGLPEDAALEDVIERLCFVAKVERGLAEADKGQTIPHAVVKQGLKRG